MISRISPVQKDDFCWSSIREKEQRHMGHMTYICESKERNVSLKEDFVWDGRPWDEE
jgi:hypothetical protein